MEVLFSEVDSKMELKSAYENKALGPDGFLFKFAQICWPEFRAMLMSMFNHFFETMEFDLGTRPLSSHPF